MNKCINKRNEQGFTLIEVLVSALLLAVGLLGLGALQTTAFKYTYSADLRAKAVLLAYDMADRMRANMDVANDEFNALYNNISSTASYADLQCMQDSTGGVAINCTAAQMVFNDAYHWTTEVKSLSSGTGVGTIVQDAADTHLYKITINWEDKGFENTSSFTLSIRP